MSIPHAMEGETQLDHSLSTLIYIIVYYIMISSCIHCDQVSTNVCAPEINQMKRFRINLDPLGMVLCGVSTAPINSFLPTEHQGECLEKCATFQGCYSYNYYYNTSKCDLLGVPVQFKIVPNCFNYWNVDELNCIENGSNVCRNGGSCVNTTENNHTCACAPGFTGRICDADINECASNPCQNCGYCSNLVAKFNCTCFPGFTGVQCQTDINECGSDPCQGNATCTDGINRYQCTDTSMLKGFRTMDLVFTVTADNDFKLYFDGVEQTNLTNHANWAITDTVILPRNTSLIAIQGINSEGIPSGCGKNAGIIASSRDGSILTDSRWKCSATWFDSWTSAGFDDSNWSYAGPIGPNGITPWNFSPNINASAFWIWNAKPYIGANTYCRLTIN